MAGASVAAGYPPPAVVPWGQVAQRTVHGLNGASIPLPPPARSELLQRMVSSAPTGMLPTSRMGPHAMHFVPPPVSGVIIAGATSATPFELRDASDSADLKAHSRVPASADEPLAAAAAASSFSDSAVDVDEQPGLPKASGESNMSSPL